MVREPEMVRAYRDTWELGLHSYLSYLRDRLMLSQGIVERIGFYFSSDFRRRICHVHAKYWRKCLAQRIL